MIYYLENSHCLPKIVVCHISNLLEWVFWSSFDYDKMRLSHIVAINCLLIPKRFFSHFKNKFFVLFWFQSKYTRTIVSSMKPKRRNKMLVIKTLQRISFAMTTIYLVQTCSRSTHNFYRRIRALKIASENNLWLVFDIALLLTYVRPNTKNQLPNCYIIKCVLIAVVVAIAHFIHETRRVCHSNAFCEFQISRIFLWIIVKRPNETWVQRNKDTEQKSNKSTAIYWIGMPVQCTIKHPTSTQCIQWKEFYN